MKDNQNNDPGKCFENVRSLLLGNKFGVLATAGPEYPYTSLVAFIASKDIKSIYFATDKNTNKYNNLVRNPKVSFLIYDLGKESIKDGKSVIALGEANLSDGKKKPKEIAEYTKTHPGLKDFVNGPNCSFIQVCIHKYKYVDDFQRVAELDM